MFDLREDLQPLMQELKTFMAEEVRPNEALYEQQLRSQPDLWSEPAIMTELKAKAKARGLWNLFMPQHGHGGRLSNLDYAHFCEQMGRSSIAPEVLNCSAPDTGNMETLILYGSDEQKKQWLEPLLDGTIRSCFSMTEPAVASSDATNIQTEFRRDGDHYVINGRKWWSTGANDERCKIAIVMGRTDSNAPKHQQQSMVLVPLDTPGVTVERALTVFGYDDAPHGHAEISFDNVRVPVTNILLGEGRGFEIAQGRLGPGRIHHCMRAIGVAERALETMCNRVTTRVAFGKPLADQGHLRQLIARSRCEIETTRLLTLKAAHMMDTVGNKAARREIAMIKAVAPEMVCTVIDRAIQAHGAAGLSQDTFLAFAYAKSRTLRIVDGPDEVHREAIAKMELKAYR
ncbi:acyl-CoA dehydrogenase family protein [Mesorhizobium sp. CAU 1732]|uniref:acyl-CoA dehydrogenase family protein n=1 Tax=Mesorhizobium sp. CAU 1732 TaxID=3140358 RepID=UPI003260EF07